jgi:hypothetical protein
MPEQFEYADSIAVVEMVSFYHGGDVLCELIGVPGIWHECCLCGIEQSQRRVTT